MHYFKDHTTENRMQKFQLVPEIQRFEKLFILVGLGRSFFVCCLAHRGSTVGFLMLQCSSGVV